MARTMTVDMGEERRLLREKQAESRLQELCDLLAVYPSFSSRICYEKNTVADGQLA
ncbi:Uncharacterised protein [Citrobacter koseri]|nr:hypothetical protein [Citrobacter koseri]STB73664.1 Uncharacterised protein [Citrobacter koseri]